MTLNDWMSLSILREQYLQKPLKEIVPILKKSELDNLTLEEFIVFFQSDSKETEFDWCTPEVRKDLLYVLRRLDSGEIKVTSEDIVSLLEEKYGYFITSVDVECFAKSLGRKGWLKA